MLFIRLHPRLRNIFVRAHDNRHYTPLIYLHKSQDDVIFLVSQHCCHFCKVFIKVGRSERQFLFLLLVIITVFRKNIAHSRCQTANQIYHLYYIFKLITESQFLDRCCLLCTRRFVLIPQHLFKYCLCLIFVKYKRLPVIRIDAIL